MAALIVVYPVTEKYLENPTEQLANNERDNGVDTSTFDMDYESFLNPIDIDEMDGFF